MEALSISDEVYDRHHTRQSSTTGELTDSSFMLNNGEELTQLGKSVYLATGIHHPVITEDDLEDLPRRFDTVAGGTKARFTWFGALCMAGIGMFVEAYIIITTGQIKSIWHVSYPECWEPSQYQRCPENIQCCGLFPNTPANNETGVCEVATDASFSAMCDSDTGYYKDSFQCNQSILGSISYSEFAGVSTVVVGVYSLCCETHFNSPRLKNSLQTLIIINSSLIFISLCWVWFLLVLSPTSSVSTRRGCSRPC